MTNFHRKVKRPGIFTASQVSWVRSRQLLC